MVLLPISYLKRNSKKDQSDKYLNYSRSKFPPDMMGLLRVGTKKGIDFVPTSKLQFKFPDLYLDFCPCIFFPVSKYAHI